MLRNIGTLVVWIGAILIIAGIIIVLVIVPGWFWCTLAALLLIAFGILLLRPVFRR